MKVQLSKPKISFLDAALFLLAVGGLVGFWLTQPNIFLSISITLLILFSFWRLKKHDNAPMLFVVGFVNSSILFGLSSGGNRLMNIISAGAIFGIVLFLFAYRHARFSHRHFINQLFSTYNSLLALQVGELFFVLTYFQVDPKNKAIIIVLWLWIYDEIIEAIEENKMSKKLAGYLALIFAVLFGAVLATINFEPGL